MAKPQRPIIAVNVFPDVDMLRDYHFGPSVSGWQAIAGRLNPLARRESAPFIFESLVRVLALNGVYQAKTQRGFADVYIRPPVELYNILDFGAYRQIADIGYRSAMEALGCWHGSGAAKGGDGASSKGTGARAKGRDAVTAPLRKTLAELEQLLEGLDS